MKIAKQIHPCKYGIEYQVIPHTLSLAEEDSM